MKDKKIIKIISTLHVTIVSIVLFIIFTLSLAFIALHHGVSVSNYSNKYVKIEQLYLKWNEKLDFSIDNIEIKTKKTENSSIDPHKITNLISKSALFIRIFEKLNLKHIQVDNTETSFNYTQNNGGHLKSFSKDYTLDATLSPTLNKLYIVLNSLHLNKLNTDIKGTILLHNYKIQTSLDVDINSDIALKIDALSNKKSLHYTIDSKKDIKSIRYLVENLHLPKSISYWITDAIDMDSLKIEKCYGWIDYNDLQNSLKYLYVKADIKKLNYTYNTKLDAVHTQHTQLLFKDGILNIYPKKAYSYGQNLGNSWVKIDFSKRPIVVTVTLLFKGKLNQDVLNILKAYKIDLPFLQKKGIVDVDLKIAIDVENLKVQTDGKFYTKKANFDYVGLNLDIYNAKILLKNYDVTIHNMYATYKDIAKTYVDVKFDAKTLRGTIDFKAKSIQLKDINLTMKKTPLAIRYNIVPNNNTINVAHSTWDFLGYDLQVNPLTIKLDTKKLLLHIPTTKIKVKDMATLYTSGTLQLPSLLSHFDIDLVAFDYYNIKLLNKKVAFKLLYNKNLEITTNQTIDLKTDTTPITLTKNNFNIKNNTIFTQTSLNLNNFIHSDIKFIYMPQTHLGSIVTQNLLVKDPKASTALLQIDTPTIFALNKTKESFYLHNKDYFIDFQATDTNLTLQVQNNTPLFNHSPLLKHKALQNSNFSLTKTYTKDTINFKSQLLYPHKILVIDNHPTQKYNINGQYNLKNKVTKMQINKKVDLTVDDTIKIDMHDVGIDIFATLDALENNTTTKKVKTQQEKNTTSPTVTLHAKNSFIYISKNRKILSDDIVLKLKDNTIASILKYKEGKAVFNLQKDNFSFYGKNFNDTFMTHLFALSKFKGGRLDFSMEGKSLKEYVGTLNLTDTTVLEYKLLNNILAFVNTIPSLITFSLPGYDKNGLLIDNAYMNFSTKDDMYNISDIYLDSKEIDILGHGKASFVKNSIDLELNLKTDLASSASKIPVVGYILFDEDSISTTLKIYGPLDNPKVKSLLAKEIIVAPLNIIKRTLMLPFNIFKTDEEK